MWGDDSGGSETEDYNSHSYTVYIPHFTKEHFVRPLCAPRSHLGYINIKFLFQFLAMSNFNYLLTCTFVCSQINLLLYMDKYNH